MSPILVRPVREQFEHDRVIRLLQARWRRRYQVGVNLGADQAAPAGPAANPIYPDLVLNEQDRGHRLAGVVEVETGESVNNLEALAEWARFGALQVPLYLYVPSGSVDAARRLCVEHAIPVTEIWSYYAIGDQVRFTLIHRAPAPDRRGRAGQAAPGARRPAAAARKSPKKRAAARRSAKPAARRAAGPPAKPAARRAAKPAARRVAKPSAGRAAQAKKSARRASSATRAPKRK